MPPLICIQSVVAFTVQGHLPCCSKAVPLQHEIIVYMGEMTVCALDYKEKKRFLKTVLICNTQHNTQKERRHGEGCFMLHLNSQLSTYKREQSVSNLPLSQ